MSEASSELTLEQARIIALDALRRVRSGAGCDLEVGILDQSTVERSWGWVFLWQSRRFIDTEDEKFLICGNSALIVNRFDGSVRWTGTKMTVAWYIEQYERSLASDGGPSAKSA